MVVYGEGAYRCAEHGAVRPVPRTEADLAAGRFEPPCPVCGQALSPELVDEDAVLDPRNTYAATKLHQEHLATVFGRETGVAVTSLRYHNVYGPRMPRDTPYAGVAAIFRSALERGEAPLVFEDGGQRRDFVHVADVAALNVAALTADEAVTGAVNVASGVPHTVGDLAVALSAAMGGPPPEVTGRYRLGDVRHVTASTRRAAEVFGFSPTVSFADGVAEFATAPLLSRSARPSLREATRRTRRTGGTRPAEVAVAKHLTRGERRHGAGEDGRRWTSPSLPHRRRRVATSRTWSVGGGGCGGGCGGRAPRARRSSRRRGCGAGWGRCPGGPSRRRPPRTPRPGGRHHAHPEQLERHDRAGHGRVGRPAEDGHEPDGRTHQGGKAQGGGHGGAGGGTDHEQRRHLAADEPGAEAHRR